MSVLCLFLLPQVARKSVGAVYYYCWIYLLWDFYWIKTLLPSAQQSHHVFGEQKQPRNWDVSDVTPGPSGQEQPEVTRGRCRELWGAASAAGHLREERHPEASAVCSSSLRTVHQALWGLCPCSTRGWVWLLKVLLLSPITDISLIENTKKKQ